MRITIEPTHEGLEGENPNPRVTIELKGDDWSMDEIIEDMIEPALVAYGFTHASEFLTKYYSQS